MNFKKRPVILALILCLLVSCSNDGSVEKETFDLRMTATAYLKTTTNNGVTGLIPKNCLPRYGELNEFLHLTPQATLWWVDSADFNDDGLPDILLSRGIFQSGETNPIEILLNDGTGSFLTGTNEVFSGEIPQVMEPREVVLADFNGDGRMDVFFADQGKDADPWPGHQNTLVLSAPEGKLVDATKNLPQQSDQTHSATAADVDTDGDVDLFLGNMGGGGVPPQLLLNDGNGVFSIATGMLPGEHTNLALNWYTGSLFADVNNDGKPDLILGQGDPNRDSHVLLNDGSGYFSKVETPLPSSFFAPEQQIVDIKAGDITGDGFLDLFLVDTRNTYFGWYIQILINNGDGTFLDETASRFSQSGENSPWMWRIDLIDLNMDGNLDIATSPTQGGGGPLFFTNDGNGVFTPQSNVFKIDHSYLWTFLDINIDGYLDVFWSYPENGSVPEIHFTTMALGCP